MITELVTIIRTGQGLTAADVERVVAMMGSETKPADVLTHNILSTRGRTIRPKTLNQKRYVDAIDAHTVVFGIAPAGTGKTYLAMAKAVQALQDKRVNRIILTRPAIEAGEKLGFLPGTLSDKIDPYLRPLYHALHDMKMFLTRLGFGSRMVVTGDITQVDLPGAQKSGLREVQGILDGVEDVAFCQLTNHDVVRHRLVGRIVAAYDRYESVRPDGERPRGRDERAGDRRHR